MFYQNRPDIVLVDLRMPGVNGLDVITKIKEDSPATPLIVVSGTGVLADAINAIRLGAWDYVSKPIDDMEVLEHIVGKALERADLLRQNKAYQEHLEEQVRTRTLELQETNSQLMDEIRERTLAQRKIVNTRINFEPWCLNSYRVKKENADVWQRLCTMAWGNLSRL